MRTDKLHPGAPFPDITATLPSGEEVSLATPTGDADWKLVLVYRGRHCPICTNYLNELESYVDELKQTGVDVIAVSGDSPRQLAAHMTKLSVSFPIAHSLSEQNMKQLGLYISQPRSEQETDHNFAEPGLFVINQEGNLHVVDISNNPFVRPELSRLVAGLKWIRNPDNNYPIRGTFN